MGREALLGAGFDHSGRHDEQRQLARTRRWPLDTSDGRALETDAPVLEGFGLKNFGSHSNNAEYVNISSIEPRLYLLTRLIMDIAAATAGVAVPTAR